MVLTVVADTCSKTVLIKSQTMSSGIQVSECVTAEFAQNSVLPSTLYCVNYKLHNWMEKRCMLVAIWVRVYLHYKRRNALHKWEDNNINDVCLLSWIMWCPRCFRDFTYIDGCNLVLWSGKSPGLKAQEKLHCYTKATQVYWHQKDATRIWTPLCTFIGVFATRQRWFRMNSHIVVNTL